MKEKNHQDHHLNHQQENETLKTRFSKSEIANMYGRSWRSFRKEVFTLIPDLRGTRRQLLHPFEVEKILTEFGKPKKLDSLIHE